MKVYLKFIPVFLVISTYLFGIVFRKFFWCDIPVAKGDPYGAGDLIELLVYGGVLLFSGVTFAQSLLLFVIKRIKNVKLGLIFVAIAILAAMTYSKVHKLIDPICS